MKSSNDFTELRRKAEHDLRDEKLDIENMSEDEILKTMHELHVHQLELEMQNEELRRARVELEDSRNKYTDLFEFAPIGYFILDKKGVIEQVNLTATSMLGIERTFLLNQIFSLYIENKEDRDVFYMNRGEVLKTGTKTRCDLKMNNKVKGEFLAELLIEPIKDSDGQVTHCRVALIDITDRNYVRQIERLAKFPEENPFPMLRILNDGTVNYSNKPGEVLLDDWKCKTGKKVPRDWRKTVSESLDSGQYLVKEVNCGQKIFSIVAAPVPDGGYVNLYGTDITKKRQAEIELQQSKEREQRRADELAALLDAVPTPVFIVHDPKSLHMTGNRKANELLHIESGSEVSLSAPEEVRPHHFKAVQDGRELSIDELPAQRAARGEYVSDFEFSLVFDDGSIRQMLSYGTPLLDEKHQPHGAVHVLVDITERKKIEEAIRIANERFELAQQGAGAGWWDWDIQTGKLLWSPELFGLFGMDSSKNEATFDSWRSVLHPDDRKKTEDIIEEAITNHTQLKNEYRIVVPDGKIRWINALGNTTYDEQGKAIRMTGICFDMTERKKAEELLRYHAALVDNMSDAVISTDKKLTILSWNEAAEQMYGWKAEDVIGNSLKQFIKPEYVDNLTRAEVLHHVFENGSWKGEVLQQRKDESKFYVSASLTVIKNEAGENIGFIAVDRDITEHKKAEEALRESEVRCRTLGETVSYGFWHTDVEGKCTYISDSFLEMTGMTLHEVLEFGWMHLLPEKDVEPTKEQWLHCVKTGEDYQRELCFRSNDGTPRYVLAIGRPVRDEEGKITSWVGINLDITSRKRAEEALRLSEQRFRLALRNAPVSVAAQDRDLRYIWAYNQKSAKREEIIGRFDEDIFTPEEAAHFRDIKLRVLIEGSDFSEQMWVNRPSGRMFVNFTWEPVFDKDGEITGVASSSVDMTKIKLAEEELRQKNEDMERFNKYAVGRELRMIELKKEINKLYEDMGKTPLYKLHFDKENKHEESQTENT